MRLLLIERDDENVHRILDLWQNVFGPENDVELAATLSQGLDYLEEDPEQFDIIMLDLDVSAEKDCCVGKVQDLTPRPVIVLIDSDDDETMLQCAREGAAGMLLVDDSLSESYFKLQILKAFHQSEQQQRAKSSVHDTTRKLGRLRRQMKGA